MDTPEIPDETFLAALNEALSGETEVRPARQGGWAGGRSAYYIHKTPPRDGAFNENGDYNLVSISHRHEAIMNWLIAHPDGKIRDCANDLGYSQGWISVVIHSDLFKARLREKQDLVFANITGTVTEKLSALADIGVEKLIAKMEVSEDAKFIHEVTKTALANLGFGAAKTAPGIQGQNVQQNNYYVASQADLEAARARIAGRAQSSQTLEITNEQGKDSTASLSKYEEPL